MRDDSGYYDNHDNHNPLLCIADDVRRHCSNVVKAARVAIRWKRKERNSKALCNNTNALWDSEIPEQTRTVQEARSIPERESEM